MKKHLIRQYFENKEINKNYLYFKKYEFGLLDTLIYHMIGSKSNSYKINHDPSCFMVYYNSKKDTIRRFNDGKKGYIPLGSAIKMVKQYLMFQTRNNSNETLFKIKYKEKVILNVTKNKKKEVFRYIYDWNIFIPDYILLKSLNLENKEYHIDEIPTLVKKALGKEINL